MRGSLPLRYLFITLVLAVFTYLYGLDSRFAPKNGDEYPYMHIVRMTAEVGNWLPLQSAMEGIKNTKPPLLFWQGIVSTNWASHWSLIDLRWPSVVYTILTAFFLILAVGRFSGSIKIGLLSGLIWLSFFASYRYGRPFLTDPSEVFWLSLPLFALLYWGKSAYESKLLYPLFAGLCLGLALFAKSFAYIAPAVMAMSLYYWQWRQWSVPQTLVRDVYKLVIITVLALGVFALWFLLDPFPDAVWAEFVLGENAGKFSARSATYLSDLVWGGDSLWMLITTTLANAGLFVFVLVSTLIQCWRERRFLSREEVSLFLFIGTFFLVFALPSQRSGRYLLPVMPAFAALIALHWERISLFGFRVALIMQAVLLLVLLYLSMQLQSSGTQGESMSWTYGISHWILLGLGLLLSLSGLFWRQRTKIFALMGCFLVYSALTSSLGPLEGQLGRYSATSIAQVSGKEVWIPCDYRAKDEEYRLLLPGARLHGYLAKDAGEIGVLTKTYPLVAVHAPLGAQVSICENCQILGKRIEMRARHTDDEIQDMLRGHIVQHLFVTEYLIATPVSNLELVNMKDACR